MPKPTSPGFFEQHLANLPRDGRYPKSDVVAIIRRARRQLGLTGRDVDVLAAVLSMDPGSHVTTTSTIVPATPQELARRLSISPRRAQESISALIRAGLFTPACAPAIAGAATKTP